MKIINIGILAHVDAGKTTLAEAILYRTGMLRRLGRVDHQDAFLDTDAMERARGITIFSGSTTEGSPPKERRIRIPAAVSSYKNLIVSPNFLKLGTAVPTI